jgi:hypothetical protein
MRFHALVGAIFLLVVTVAEAQSPGEIAYLHLNRVKPGMTTQYESTRKRHWLWHKKLGDTWSFQVWQIVSGEATGAYIISSFGHTWKEVDESDRLLGGDEDPGASVEPYLDSESESYYRYVSDLSLAPQNFSPAPKLAVTRFLLKPEGVNDFLDGVKKIKEGIRKTSYPLAGSTRWYQLVSGGEGPQFLLLSDRANWAAFEPPTVKNLDSMMEGAYGKQQGPAILRTVRSAIRSQYLETWQYRSDLSFAPEPK